MARARQDPHPQFPHPGKVLREQFLEPMRISVEALAKALHLPCAKINDLVRERHGLDMETATRLAGYFRTPEDLWTELQLSYDVAQVRSLFAERMSAQKERPGTEDRKEDAA
jgi:addiction module HigA family antidote